MSALASSPHRPPFHPAITFLVLMIATLLHFAGCATVPPEAADHAAKLSEYQQKTTQGTIAAFDTVVHAHDFAVDALGGQVQSLWREYVNDTQKAANDFERVQVQLESALSRLDAVDWGTAAADAERVRNAIAQASSLSADSAQQFSSFSSDGAAAMKDDVEAMASLRGAAQTASGELRDLIVEHNTVVAEGIGLHRDLFESYNMVAIQRNEFFGGKFEARTEDLQAKMDGLVSTVKDKASAFTSVVRALFTENP